MYKRSSGWFCAGAGLAGVGILSIVSEAPAATPNPSLRPATMPRVGTVDEHYQSYNVEMLEVMRPPTDATSRCSVRSQSRRSPPC
jgi:hypothetical protein